MAIVPLNQWHSRYFSSRNIAMVVGGMVTTYLAGWLITLLGVPRGYQVAMAGAFAIGNASPLRDPLCVLCAPCGESP